MEIVDEPATRNAASRARASGRRARRPARAGRASAGERAAL